MQQMNEGPCRRLALALTIGALATLGLSACGGSSGSSSTSTHANVAAALDALRAKSGVSTRHNRSGATGPSSTAPRFTALRTCLQKQGVQLPTRPGGGPGLFLAGANPPKGVTRAQLQSAVRKCLAGRGSLAGRPGGARFGGSRSPRFRQALTVFAACLRKNGVNLPQPNTSGNGPVFSTKGLNTASPQFKAAYAKCRPALTGALGLPGARPGVGG